MPAWNKIIIPKEELQKLYVEQRLSLVQIASKLGYSTTPIYRLLHYYKIPIRTLNDACDKVIVSKEQIKTWYVKDKLSMAEIGKRLGCTHSAIVYKLRALGITSRGNLGTRKPLKLTKEKLEYFYNKGLSLRKIAKIFHSSEGGIEKRFNKYGIKSRGMSNRAHKYKKFNFSKNPIEKAYILGFRLGDLNVMKRVSVISVRCSTTHKAQVKLISNLFSEYTTPYTWKAKRGTLEIVCLVNKSFNFLLPKHKNIPYWVQENDEYFWSFIAGYSDAEGSFYDSPARKNGKTYHRRTFELQSQDKGILKDIHLFLDKKGIKQQKFFVSRKAGHIDKRGIINNKDMWRIAIGEFQSLVTFVKNIEPYLKHKEKVDRIESFNIHPYPEKKEVSLSLYRLSQ